MFNLNDKNKGYLISIILLISFSLTTGLNRVKPKNNEIESKSPKMEVTTSPEIEATPFDFDIYLDMTAAYILRLYDFPYIICLSGTGRRLDIGIFDFIHDPTKASFRPIENGKIGTYVPHPISGRLVPVYIGEDTEMGKCGPIVKQRYSVPSVEFIEDVRGPYLDL